MPVPRTLDIRCNNFVLPSRARAAVVLVSLTRIYTLMEVLLYSMNDGRRPAASHIS